MWVALLAYAILAFVPGRSMPCFVISFAIALIGIGVLVLLVDDRRDVATTQAERTRVAFAGLLLDRDFQIHHRRGSVGEFRGRQRCFLICSCSRAEDADLKTIPLLYVGSACAISCWRRRLAVADRLGAYAGIPDGQVFMIASMPAWRGSTEFVDPRTVPASARRLLCGTDAFSGNVSRVTRTEVRAMVSLRSSRQRGSRASVWIGSGGHIWSWRGPQAVVIAGACRNGRILIWSAITLRQTNLDVRRDGPVMMTTFPCRPFV